MTDSTPTPRTTLQRLAYIAGTAASGMGAVLRHLSTPAGDLHAGPAMATHAVWGRPPSAERPRVGFNAGEVYVRGYQDGVARVVGIRAATGVRLAVIEVDRAVDALRAHTPLHRSEDGPIVGCTCGELRLGDAWSVHAALAVFDNLATVEGHEPVQPRTDEPITAAGSPPGYRSVKAGGVTEFAGRHVILPPDLHDVPQGPVLLESARFEFHTDGNTAPDAVLVKIAGHEQPYMLLPDHVVQVQMP